MNKNKKPKGILVTDYQSFNGAQSKNIILFLNNVYRRRNFILRSVSFIIMIGQITAKHSDNYQLDEDLPNFLPDPERDQLYKDEEEARIRRNETTHLHQEAKILPVKTQSEMLTKQYLQSMH